MGIGNWRGNNIVVSGGQRGDNMVVGGGQRGGNMVVGGGQRRGNSIGGSKRSNNIGGSIGWDSVVDKSWISLSISLTLDNVLNGTILGNIRWSIDTVGHSSVVGGAVVACDGVAGKGTNNWGNNMVVVVSGQRGSNSSDSWGSNSSDDRGSNSSDKWGGNRAEMAISGIWGGSIRAIDEGRVSLSFSLTLGNDVSVVKPVGERSDKRGGGVGGQRGGGIAGQR